MHEPPHEEFDGENAKRNDNKNKISAASAAQAYSWSPVLFSLVIENTEGRTLTR